MFRMSFAALAAAVLVAGCGGGGGGDSALPQPPVVVAPSGSLSLLAGAVARTEFPECVVDGQGASARFQSISGISTDKAGHVYVAELARCHAPLVPFDTAPSSGINLVRKIDPTGLVATKATVIRFSSFESMTASGAWTGLGAAQDGRVFVAQYSDGAAILGPRLIGGVFRVDPDGAVTFKDLGEVALSDVAIASDGRVQTTSGTVDPVSLELTRPPRAVDSLSGAPVGFSSIAFGADDVLYGASRTGVYRQSAPGVFTLLAGHSIQRGMVDAQGGEARFADIKAGSLGVDSKGNVFVADNGHLVRKITPDGKVSTVAGQPGEDSTVELGELPGKLTGVSGLAVGPDDSIYLNAQSAVLKLALE
ncbi:hypothetical protein AAFF27_07590 [Xylophilus sp. GW821-FHT01B05]